MEIDPFGPAIPILENPLTYPGLAVRKHARVLLRVWRYPAFEPYSSWAAIESADGLFVRRIEWDPCGNDISKPTTFGSETKLEQRNYDVLLAELCTISLVPFPSEAPIGLDGTFYGVEQGGFFSATKLVWWESGPSGWEALHEWHERAMAAFDSLLPASTARSD